MCGTALRPVLLRARRAIPWRRRSATGLQPALDHHLLGHVAGQQQIVERRRIDGVGEGVVADVTGDQVRRVAHQRGLQRILGHDQATNPAPYGLTNTKDTDAKPVARVLLKAVTMAAMSAWVA